MFYLMFDTTDGSILAVIGNILYNDYGAISDLTGFTFVLMFLNLVEIPFIIGYTWTKRLNIIKLFILIAVNLASAYFSLATLGGMV